jgi:hypothetical protein
MSIGDYTRLFKMLSFPVETILIVIPVAESTDINVLHIIHRAHLINREIQNYPYSVICE